MLEEIHDIEYWKKEYLEISKDNDKLELELQQYKQQIDDLEKWLEDEMKENECHKYHEEISWYDAYEEVLSKLKERNEE